jgi:hypothetical protein
MPCGLQSAATLQPRYFQAAMIALKNQATKITRARLTSSAVAPWIAGQWGQGGITGCRYDARRQELFLRRAKKT